MTTPPPEWTPTLPGITLPTTGHSGIEASARATLAHLEAQGLLKREHALTAQVVLELARAVGHGLQFGKVTVATATLSKHLLEAIDKLPAPPEAKAQGGDAWAQLERQLAEATAAGAPTAGAEHGPR